MTSSLALTSTSTSTSTCAAITRNMAPSRVGVVGHDLEQQRLRILRCTAQAMASGPGGLRFKAGTRPWLEGLSSGRPRIGLGGVMQPAIE